MRRRKRSNFLKNLTRSLTSVWEFLSDNKKKVMPVILLICVAVTILIAIRANRIAADQAMESADETESGLGESFDITEAVLSEDAYPEVNAIISRYFEAYASGDVSILNSGLYRTLDEIETVTVEERAKYIEEVKNLKVYTKPGPVQDSFVAYAYTDVRYIGCDDFLPGVVSFYVCRDESGEYYINADESAQSVKDYISAVSLQDDVVDLCNRVNVEYTEKLKSDEMFAELVAAIYAEIDESIGERLAGVEEALADAGEAASQVDTAAGQTEAGESSTEGQTDAGEADTAPKDVKIRATTVVNVRSSDSTEAEVLGKTEVGAEYIRISEQGNGWSKISFAGGAAYVKTEFFEVVEEETVQAPDDANEAAEDGAGQTETTAETEQAAGQTEDTEETQATITTTGKKKVSTGVRLRKSASTEAEILETLYGGAVVDVKVIRADGWSEVEYKGRTGYIKTEFLSDI